MKVDVSVCMCATEHKLPFLSQAAGVEVKKILGDSDGEADKKVMFQRESSK